DADHRSTPRLDDAARDSLQRVNHVFDEEQAVSVTLQLLVALNALGARDRCDRALLERLRDEAVRVCERRGREAVASVVFGREGEEEFARRGRGANARGSRLSFVSSRLPRKLRSSEN